MASTSKYIQLDPQVLVEYQYTDPVNAEIISAADTGARVLLLENTYTKSNMLFNEDNPLTLTGNYRRLSAIPIDIDRNKYAYLTTSSVLNYLDYDNILPSQIIEDGTQIKYDTIKIHMVSGFSFEDLGDGFIFEVLLRDRSGTKHNLASIVYRKSDNYEISNPSPFISNERLFSKYIEIKVPSSYWITDSWVESKNDQTSFSNLLSSNSGYSVQNTIELSIRYINSTEYNNGQTYFYPGESIVASINTRDEYSGLNAVIEDSNIGDFFEVYGSYNGDIYEDFMVELNNMPDSDLVVVHDILVLEQIGTSFIKTSEQSFIQTDSYDETYKFRPIILNSHIATSYRIDYSLRILNKVDNSQIIRRAQYSSFDVKKYGRRFRKLNLGTVPTITKVYNDLPSNINDITLNNDVQFNIEGNKVVQQVEFVQGFKESINISASITNVKTTPYVNIEGDINNDENNILNIINSTPSDVVYKQGEGAMIVSPFDDFVKFIFYDNSLQESNGSANPRLMDLTNTGSFYLSFIDDSTGDEIRIKNYTNVKDISPAQGEVIFRIGRDDSKKILKFKSNNFYISARLEVGSEKSDETMMYVGQWYKPEDKHAITSSSIIKKLKDSSIELNNKLVAETQASNEIIRELEINIETLTKEKKLLEDRLTELSGNVIELTSTIKDNIKRKDNLALTKIVKNAPNVKLIKDRMDKGLGKFVSPKSFEKIKGLSMKSFKINP